MSAFNGLETHDHLRIWDGVTVQAVEGERTTLAFVDLEPRSTVPEHRHDNEQLGILIRGAMWFRIADAGSGAGSGSGLGILSDVPHEVTAGPEGALAVECFTPVRSDWAGLERLVGRPAPKLR